MKKIDQTTIKKEIKVCKEKMFKPAIVKFSKPYETLAPPNTPAMPVRTIKK